MSQRYLLIYCGLLMTISAFATDIVLPAMGLMRDAFSVPIETVQMTVPAYMVGLGAGQLFFGPASDRFGRRSMVLAALLLFLAGTLACLAAPTASWLLAGRFVQGLGGGAVQVIARAIVRDRSSGTELAQNMAMISAIFAIGPILAPLAGYAVTASGFWQGAFVALAVLAVLLVTLAWQSSETLARPMPDALAPTALLRRAARVMRHPQSRRFVLFGGLAMTALLSYLTNSPRLFIETLGTTPFAFVLFFGLSATGIVIGQLTNRRLIRALGTVSASIVGAVVLCLSALAIAVIDLLGLSSPWTLCLCMLAFNTSYLVVFANAIALALDPHGDIAGFTASFSGFVSASTASVLAAIITAIADGAILPWALGMLSVAVLCVLMLLDWRFRRMPALR
ncbi:MAG: MFS transporter [Geminicoccaceae bacterium]